MRKRIVAGNWKMNGNKSQIRALLSYLQQKLSAVGSTIECVVCPPSIYIDQVSHDLKSSDIQIGGQNCASLELAAFTGEISPIMLRDFGCNYVIIGHSERRLLLDETDDVIASKFQLAQAAGLKPILCVGETKEQMESGQGFATVERQLQAVLTKVGVKVFSNAVVAYEPVWAIGTGLSATPEQAQSMHQQIRAKFAGLDSAIAAELIIIYGGSVTSSNAAALFQQLDIDGGLIGGASLKAQDFSDICHAAMSSMVSL